MEFDRSALRHRLTVAPSEPRVFDVFVRTDSGTVEHYWSGELESGVMFGPETISGAFTSEPVAVWAFDETGSHLHLIGRQGMTLMDWRWDNPSTPGPLGSPDVVTLPGICVRNPAVVADGGAVHVVAARLDTTIRHWALGPEGWSGPDVIGSGGSELALIRRAPGVLDVFAIRGALAHGTNESGAWTFETRTATNIAGPPTAAAFGPDRLDVFATRSDGVPVHWGKKGSRWFDEEVVVDLTFGSTGVVRASDDLQLVAFGEKRLDLFARTTAGALAEWTLQAPHGWSGPNVLNDGVRSFDAWSSKDEQVEALTRQRDGSFVHWFFENDPDLGMGEPVAGSFIDNHLVATEPEPTTINPVPAPVVPDALLVRPPDLLLIGVQWSGFEVQPAAGGAPAELIAGPAAELTLVFPPQHIAEEVIPVGGVAEPGLPLAATAGIPTWRSALAGASRVVVAIDEGEGVPLTGEGVLDAARRGRLVPSTGVADTKTALELPFGLVISPHHAEGVPIALAHPTIAAEAGTGAVGLWQTTIALRGTPAGSPAGLALRAIAARPTDPFPIALTRGARGRIVIEPPTARIDRLMLSSLGGSLTATGSWDAFAWEHTTALGRDRRVRTAVEGVLYPFGHRAEYIEVTERVFESTAEGAVAHLRKATSLRIIEPLRREAPDAPSAAFPFSEVEFERTVFEGVAADWTTKDFPTPERVRLEELRDEWLVRAGELQDRILGDAELAGTVDPMEELAAGNAASAGELLDPEDPEAGTREFAARTFLGMRLQAEHIDDQLSALEDATTVTVDLFFVPRPLPDPNLPPTPAAPLRFPVRLRGRLGDVHVTIPVVFVSDVRLRPGLFTPEYSTLDDPDVLQQVADAYRDEGDGVVEVGGAKVDFVRSDAPVKGDVFEVQRLHLAGELVVGGFRPRLGAAPEANEDARPPAERWAFETVLPAVRTLLGHDRALQLAFSRTFLEGEPDGDIPFQIPKDFPALATDFAKNSGRSGGIVAPDIVADGISRMHGPVNVEGMLARVAGTLDPKRILGDTATLLGYPLADLIDATALKDPPAILHGIAPGGTPVVTLQWRRIALDTDTGSFVAGPGSSLDLDVTIGAAGQSITCTLTGIALALPDRAKEKKLIEVTIGQVKFTQVNGQAPDLELLDIGATFFGVLKLLEDLQNAVDLGDAAPQISASSDGITASYTLPVPDVATGAFQLTGLVFHGGIDVPFDERLVTLSLAFASREKPFNLSVLLFGGGGYVDIAIDKTGLRRLELALEFGASVAVDFVVATGEVHALGGIRMLKSGDDFALTGYLRFGGSVTILGLVTASIEVTVELTYRTAANKMIGRATLVLEIDLTLFSESVEIDTGDWVIAGDDERDSDAPANRVLPRDDEERTAMLDEWRRYRSAFAEEPVA